MHKGLATTNFGSRLVATVFWKSSTSSRSSTPALRCDLSPIDRLQCAQLDLGRFAVSGSFNKKLSSHPDIITPHEFKSVCLMLSRGSSPPPPPKKEDKTFLPTNFIKKKKKLIAVQFPTSQRSVATSRQRVDD